MTSAKFFICGDDPFRMAPNTRADLDTLLEAIRTPTLLYVTAELTERDYRGTVTFTAMEVRDWRQVETYQGLWLPRTQLKRLGAALNSGNWLPQHFYLAAGAYVGVTFTLETL